MGVEDIEDPLVGPRGFARTEATPGARHAALSWRLVAWLIDRSATRCAVVREAARAHDDVLEPAIRLLLGRRAPFAAG